MSTSTTPAPSVSSSIDRQALAAMRGIGRKIDASDPRQVRRAATELVSQVFFAPMLQSLRENTMGGQIGSGGRGEEAFGEQLDQQIADIVASEGARPLVDKIAAKLTKKHANDELPGPSAVWNSAIKFMNRIGTPAGAVE